MTDLKLNASSKARLAQAHPLLIKLFTAVAAETGILIMDSQRGKAAQEKAFKEGHSKAHFGQSAHNWAPSIALDVAPLPLDWNNRKAFIDLSKIVLRHAKEMSIPIRWGGDWDGDGDMKDQTLVDLPHYELSPWREYAKKSKPYVG